MAIVKASAKGQVVIPAEIRRKVGIEPGDRLVVEVRDGLITLSPLARDSIAAFTGIWKDCPSLTKDLLEERRKDREREEAEIVGRPRASGLAPGGTGLGDGQNASAGR